MGTYQYLIQLIHIKILTITNIDNDNDNSIAQRMIKYIFFYIYISYNNNNTYKKHKHFRITRELFILTVPGKRVTKGNIYIDINNNNVVFI